MHHTWYQIYRPYKSCPFKKKKLNFKQRSSFLASQKFSNIFCFYLILVRLKFLIVIIITMYIIMMMIVVVVVVVVAVNRIERNKAKCQDSWPWERKIKRGWALQFSTVCNCTTIFHIIYMLKRGWCWMRKSRSIELPGGHSYALFYGTCNCHPPAKENEHTPEWMELHFYSFPLPCFSFFFFFFSRSIFALFFFSFYSYTRDNENKVKKIYHKNKKMYE